jgi:NitT/TauT family transport system substrate-binding protein
VHPHCRVRLFIAGLAFFLPFLTASLQAAETQKTERIRIGYSSISGSRIGLWVAQDKGFFTRHGLHSELVVLSGILGIQSLIAGEIQSYLGATDSAAQAASKGSDLFLFASAEPLRYKLIAQPNIKTVKELRGKKIVIDRVGGTSYYVSLRLLEKVGLKPEDVDLIQVGGGGNQRVASFKTGVVSAVINSTERFEQMKVPYNALADAGDLGIKTMGNSYMSTRSLRTQKRDVIQRTVRAMVEARAWMKEPKNRDAVLDVYKRYLRLDEGWVLDLYYKTYIEPVPIFPYTDVDDLREFVSYMPDGNKTLQSLNLNDFADSSFLKRIEQEGVGARR